MEFAFVNILLTLSQSVAIHVLCSLSALTINSVQAASLAYLESLHELLKQFSDTQQLDKCTSGIIDGVCHLSY